MPAIEIKALPAAAEPVSNAIRHFRGGDLPLYASFSGPEDQVLAPGQRVIIPTGIAVAMPSDVEGQILSDRELSYSKGLVVLNSPGTIDPDYHGEISAILINMGHEPVTIPRGMLVARMRFANFVRVKIVEIEILPQSERGSNGLGSTGGF